MPKKKQKSVKTLKRKLDIIFSKWIRERDTDWRGYGNCCSCGKTIRYEDGDAGHFISRGKQNTRYDETNVHLQCRRCNRFENGNIIGYYEFMEKKYGKDHIEKLKKKNQESKTWTPEELEKLIKKYENKTN